MIKSFEDIYGNGEETQMFSASLMMGIAYSATIGGVATIVGTPPNLAFVRIYSMNFPDQSEFNFISCIKFGIQKCQIMLLSALFVLFKRVRVSLNLVKALFKMRLENWGNENGRKWIGLIFIMTPLLVFRKN